MRGEVFAEVSGDGVTVYGEKKFFSPLPQGIFFDADLPKIKTRSLVLAANLRQTIVRVAEISEKPSREAQWELVQKHFPLGEKINENTYVFDGCVFANERGARFFMTALPVAACDALAKIGARIAGSIHRVARIETVEHMLFEKFCAETIEPTLVFFPQENSVRVLHVAENLPAGAGFISIQPAYRAAEFSRFYGVLEHPPKNAILLRGANFDWLRAILSEKNFTIQERDDFL